MALVRVKTRSLAAKLVTSGAVRLNKDKVGTASQPVKVDDVLTIVRGNQVLVYKVLALGSRRGPASEAQSLFEDLSPKPEKQEHPIMDAAPEAGQPRPSKKDRRDLMRLKRGFADD